MTRRRIATLALSLLLALTTIAHVPAASARSPSARNRCAASAVVVVFPLVPVTAM